MVWSIWEMLCLKAYSRASWECRSVLSLVAVSPVVSVKLYSRLCCVNLHGSATYRLCNLGGKAQLSFLFLVQNIAMVVACAILYLLVIGINILTYGLWCAEVKRSTLYEADFACRDAGLVNWQLVVCIDFADKIVYCWCWVCDS